MLVGSSQTLILINGQRTSNFANRGATFRPDINGLPLAAIERVEVLPGSASAIYGGTAVGGVVNVILAATISISPRVSGAVTRARSPTPRARRP